MKIRRVRNKTALLLLAAALGCMAGAGAASAEPVPVELKTKPAVFVSEEVSSPSAAERQEPAAAVTIQSAPAVQPAPAPPVVQEKKIVINTASRMVTLYEGGKKTALYRAGVGKVSTPTPSGFYEVQTKEINPTWIDPGDTSVQIPSGPDNPLGYRWIGFSGTYGIHGTNRPDTVGYYVSNGCVRLKEEDVEDLYRRVSVGTPVMVYYDRIVIDSAPDHTVSYYIYPDGYGWQNLTVPDVKRALRGYGVDTFASAASIAEKIAASDGLPTYVAKAYDIIVYGKKLPMRALQKDGILYLPAVAVATALRLDLHWKAADQVLTSPYGTAAGMVRSDVVYMKAADASSLFRMEGSLTPALQYVMTPAAVPAEKKRSDEAVRPANI